MTRQTHKQAMKGERLLRKAVLDELRHKAKLDQYVIINRDGKPCKVPAEEALREAEQGGEVRSGSKLP